jgi:hypothetical protein
MEFLQEASDEMSAAALWYEERGAGIGSRFLDEVDAAVEHIERNPALGARWHVTQIAEHIEVRRLPLRRYPYLIVYVVEPALTVVAIAHAHRRPGYWAERVK